MIKKKFINLVNECRTDEEIGILYHVLMEREVTGCKFVQGMEIGICDHFYVVAEIKNIENTKMEPKRVG